MIDATKFDNLEDYIKAKRNSLLESTAGRSMLKFIGENNSILYDEITFWREKYLDAKPYKDAAIKAFSSRPYSDAEIKAMTDNKEDPYSLDINKVVGA